MNNENSIICKKMNIEYIKKERAKVLLNYTYNNILYIDNTYSFIYFPFLVIQYFFSSKWKYKYINKKVSVETF